MSLSSANLFAQASLHQIGRIGHLSNRNRQMTFQVLQGDVVEEDGVSLPQHHRRQEQLVTKIPADLLEGLAGRGEQACYHLILAPIRAGQPIETKLEPSHRIKPFHGRL